MPSRAPDRMHASATHDNAMGLMTYQFHMTPELAINERTGIWDGRVLSVTSLTTKVHNAASLLIHPDRMDAA